MEQEQDRLRRRLHKTLDEYFNESELRTLCFELDLDYDNLGDDGKSDRARELVAYHWRRGALMSLVRKVEALRPASRYADYFRQMLRDSIFATQELDIRELKRMRNTGQLGLDLTTFLALNDKVERLRIRFYVLVALIVALQVAILLMLVLQ